MLEEKFAAEIATLRSRYADHRSLVLPVLYFAQDAYGKLTPDIIREVAEVLELPYTDVFEVVSFYTLYYDKPVGKWVIQVCDDTPCCYLGAEELISALKKELNIREDQTSADGMFTLQRVKCLATCQRAPVVQANLSYFYDVTVERMDAFLRHLREHADSPQAASVSGRYAEDYEPAPDGTFRMMERRLGDVPGVAADPIEVEDAVQRDSAAAMERMQQAARQAGVETQAAAERRAEAESPVEMGPDRSPASAHPDPQRTHGEALPAQSSQREQSHDESAS